MLWTAARAASRLGAYKPSRVTLSGVLRWARQFPREARRDLMKAAASMRFYSEGKTVESLGRLNDEVLAALGRDGIEATNVIYVTTDQAGSSSGVMLNLLRNRANLEQRGAVFAHYGEGLRIQRLTMDLRRGAIVYVDDFAGTGKQFMRSRKYVAEYIAGAFSEFLLVPCLCEEAQQRIEGAGVSARSEWVHRRSERPFLEECGLWSEAGRERVRAVSREYWEERVGLGFCGLATNVVFFHNAPNTTPLIFRGHRGQEPIRGIVPRYDDLAG